MKYFMLVFLLSSCSTSASQPLKILEHSYFMGVLSYKTYTSIDKFQDGNNTCYIATQATSAISISCVKN